MNSIRTPDLTKYKTYFYKRSETDKTCYNPSHTHDGMEIFILLKGDIDFIVEGYKYHLEPNDIIILRENEIHQLICNSNIYERIVIGISDIFFINQACEFYKDIFLKRPMGYYNLIKSSIVKSSGIYDAFFRIDRYFNESGPEKDTVVKCAIVEILHLLNNVNLLDNYPLSQDNTIQRIIQYVNQNLTSPITLDEISSKFFISKQHLCRTFKLATGFTVSKYITHKRIILVKQFAREGKNIGAACIEAGFRDYSNFYKIYVKKTGLSPKAGLNYAKTNV